MIDIKELFKYSRIAEQLPGFSGGGDSVLDSNGKLKNSVLPNGYPYVEYEFEPITWDGNTEGKLCVVYENPNSGEEKIFCKIADLPVEGYRPEDTFATPAVIGNEIYYGSGSYSFSGGMKNGEILSIGDVGIAIAKKDNVTYWNGQKSFLFPEAGIYFGKKGDEFVSWFAGTETVFPMRDDFIPPKKWYYFCEEYGEFYYEFESDIREDDFYSLQNDVIYGDALCTFCFISNDSNVSMSCNSAAYVSTDDAEEIHLHFIDHHNNIKHTVILVSKWDDDDNFGVDVSHTEESI